ncbi:endonuclease domain-containing protein [Novosphingobium sp. BL-8A]|uniref:endonuclease domain-containing protein n=1 Tax=Novosphingobium sp. BL-8A TaxID=3127639 RepID=UPI003756AE08
MLQGSGGAARRARRLRREMTLPEVLLWQRLRQKPAGLKFRRQHPSGNYVADFYCHDARLVVEVDGSCHDMGNNPARDAKRDAWFQEIGLRVIRVPASDVLRDADEATAFIASVACQPIPPRAGEDK